MGRFTDFTLYWEEWGGYPDRESPFGMPNLTWFAASAGNAARCQVTGHSGGSRDVSWQADWQRIPYELLQPVPGLLREAGAFGRPVPLVEEGGDGAEGPYLVAWELTGVLRGRPYHRTVEFTAPWPRWTPLGRRLSDALDALRACKPES